VACGQERLPPAGAITDPLRRSPSPFPCGPSGPGHEEEQGGQDEWDLGGALRGVTGHHFASSIFLVVSAPAFFTSAVSATPIAFTSTITLRIVPVNFVLFGW
jgi:hypothetical protein